VPQLSCAATTYNMANKDDFIGPGAPWVDNRDIEYVRDDVLFGEAIDFAAESLREALRIRLDALKEPTLDVLLQEIQVQMTSESSRGSFGSVRELHDLALSLYMARENTRRAV
jgi:hypothetical protein